MGSGSSSQGPGGGSGEPVYPSPRTHSVAYPQSRGPRTFDQVPNVNVSAGPPVSHGAQPPPNPNAVNVGASTSAIKVDVNVHLANNPSKYKDGQIVFETFHHRDGDEYSCVYISRCRFYMSSWDNGIWVPFPEDMYGKGFIITNNIIEEASNPALTSELMMSVSYGQSTWNGMTENQVIRNIEDCREGWVQHPTKGNVSTYLFEERRNVHCFFDEPSGQWTKMPLALELLSQPIADMVNQIEKNVDGWRDKHDILAALRASNYDIQDCVRNRHLAGRDHCTLSTSASVADQKLLQSKEIAIQELEIKLKGLVP